MDLVWSHRRCAALRYALQREDFGKAPLVKRQKFNRPNMSWLCQVLCYQEACDSVPSMHQFIQTNWFGRGHVYVSTGTSSSHFTSNCKAGQNLSQCAKEAGYEVGMVAPIQWVAFQQSSRAFRQMQFSKTSYPKPRCCHTLKFRVDETAGQSHQTNRVGWDISIEIEKSDARWQTKANREKKNPYTHRRFVGMLQYSSPNPLTRMIEHQKWVRDQYCIPISSTFNFYWDHPKVYKPPNKTWEANKLVLGNLRFGMGSSLRRIGGFSSALEEMAEALAYHCFLQARVRAEKHSLITSMIWELCWFQWCCLKFVAEDCAYTLCLCVLKMFLFFFKRHQKLCFDIFAHHKWKACTVHGISNAPNGASFFDLLSKSARKKDCWTERSFKRPVACGDPQMWRYQAIVKANDVFTNQNCREACCAWELP